MDYLLEKDIKENCPHCDPSSQAFLDLLEETPNFRIVCDHHPLVEGHILIIPKQHLSSVGEYPQEVFDEFLKLYNQVFGFIRQTYGTVSSFEHGKIGQTVFHSHVHLLPYQGQPEDIIPEGLDKLKSIPNLTELKNIFASDGQYLFFSIAENKWIADTGLGVPRFFRDRFAVALDKPERGNWKNMHVDKKIMSESHQENTHCMELWHNSK